MATENRFIRTRLSIKFLRWVFVILYVLLLVLLAYEPLLYPGGNPMSFKMHLLAFMVICQLLFVLGAGTIELCRPIKRRRLLAPILVAGLMMALLSAALAVASWELFYLEHTVGALIGRDFIGRDLLPGIVFPIIFLFSWIVWGLLFYVYTHRLERFTVLVRLTTAVLAGSLVELLAAVPAHIIVRQRPGCLVGLLTMIGIVAGIYVMLWSFGPGIILLFLRDRRAAELQMTTKIAEKPQA